MQYSIVHMLVLSTINLHTKFKVSIFAHARHNGAPYNSRNSATAEGLCVHTMSVKTMSTAKQLYEKYQPKRPAISERPSMLFKVICINASINHI